MCVCDMQVSLLRCSVKNLRIRLIEISSDSGLNIDARDGPTKKRCINADIFKSKDRILEQRRIKKNF